MPVEKSIADLSVLLLHNIDPEWEDDEAEKALREVAAFESALRTAVRTMQTLTVSNSDLAACLHGYHPDEYIVFNWCEEIPGKPRSEADVPMILESLKFTYTGSSPEVLAFCWDKVKVKELMNRRNIPTPQWGIYDSLKTSNWQCYPAIVKPSREHCSLGVTAGAVVRSPEELRKRVAYILENFHQPALVEDFIDGREFHVTYWGNNATIEMLPPAEMDFAAFDDIRDRLCTYESKFRPGSRHYEQIGLKLPAPLTEAEYGLLQSTGVTTYQAFGCRDYARLDIRLRDGVFYVIDVNPNADVSFEASMACAAEAAGFTYSQMIARIVGYAAQRHPLSGADGT